jgi:thioredoxin
MKKILMGVLSALILAACGGASEARSAQNENQQKEQQSKTTTVMKPIHLTKAEFLKKVVDYEGNPTEWKYLGEKPAIIDFYASWCGPCKRVAPILDELAAEYGDKIDIYKIDTEQEQELAAAFGIRSIPTLLFVPMEGKPQMVQGAIGKADFEKIIQEVLLAK